MRGDRPAGRHPGHRHLRRVPRAERPAVLCRRGPGDRGVARPLPGEPPSAEGLPRPGRLPGARDLPPGRPLLQPAGGFAVPTARRGLRHVHAPQHRSGPPTPAGPAAGRDQGGVRVGLLAAGEDVPRGEPVPPRGREDGGDRPAGRGQPPRRPLLSGHLRRGPLVRLLSDGAGPGGGRGGLGRAGPGTDRGTRGGGLLLLAQVPAPRGSADHRAATGGIPARVLVVGAGHRRRPRPAGRVGAALPPQRRRSGRHPGAGRLHLRPRQRGRLRRAGTTGPPDGHLRSSAQTPPAAAPRGARTAASRLQSRDGGTGGDRVRRQPLPAARTRGRSSPSSRSGPWY